MAQFQQRVSKPVFFLIAGPNGAGKSTFSRILVDSYTKSNDTYIWDGDLEFFKFRANYALINGKYSLEHLSKDYVSNELNSKFETLKNNAIRTKNHFALETNLFPNDCLDLIKEFKSNGYSVVMFFITLPTPDYCYSRVKLRSKSTRKNIPNHFVPLDTIKLKFECGLINFNHLNNHHKLFDKSYILLNDNSISNDIRIPTVLAKYRHGDLYELSSVEKPKHAQLISKMKSIGFDFNTDSKNIKKDIGLSF